MIHNRAWFDTRDVIHSRTARAWSRVSRPCTATMFGARYLSIHQTCLMHAITLSRPCRYTRPCTATTQRVSNRRPSCRYGIYVIRYIYNDIYIYIYIHRTACACVGAWRTPSGVDGATSHGACRKPRIGRYDWCIYYLYACVCVCVCARARVCYDRSWIWSPLPPMPVSLMSRLLKGGLSKARAEWRRLNDVAWRMSNSACIRYHTYI
jgi:hypothetical protein